MKKKSIMEMTMASMPLKEPVLATTPRMLGYFITNKYPAATGMRMRSRDSRIVWYGMDMVVPATP